MQKPNEMTALESTESLQMTFTIPSREFGGQVYDALGEVFRTALQVTLSESANLFYSYCVDAMKQIDRTKLYTTATMDQIEALFDQFVVEKIRWIINHSYPFIGDTTKLDAVCGSSNITAIEAVAATQAAIWSLTNPDDFVMGDQSVGNSNKRIMKSCGSRQRRF